MPPLTFLLQFVEKHPLIMVVGGLAGVLLCVTLDGAVANLFLYAGLLAAGMAGSMAVGLSLLIGLLGRPVSRIKSDSDGLLLPITTRTPARSPELDDPPGPAARFADRLLLERLERPERPH